MHDEARGATEAQLPPMGRLLVRASGPSVLEPRVAIVLAVGATAAVVGLDWLTGPDLSGLVAYAGVVVIAAWVIGARAGVLVALGEAAGSAAVSYWHPHARPDVTVHVVALNAGFRFAVLAALASGAALLCRTLAILHSTSHTDPLTGVLNRRALFDLAEIERARAQRHGRSIAVAYIDLDGLKAVNDRDGHEVGDRMIGTFARLASAGLRTTDLIARLGGDEFVVVMAETSAEHARAVFERVAHTPGAPSASVGIVVWRGDLPSVAAMVSAADTLMYETKSAGTGISVRMASVRY